MTQHSDDKIKVLIADDHVMILEMLEIYLAETPDIWAKTVKDLPAVLDAIQQDGVYDLILVDLDMPGMNGLGGLTQALEANGGKPVGILTSNPSNRIVEEAMALGAAGIVLKTASLKNLANELRLMAGGGRYLPMELIGKRASAPAAAPSGDTAGVLSPREKDVLQLLAEGLSNRDIGARLSLAEPTVKMHVKSVCRKLGVSNRTQAVIQARDRKLVE